MDLLTELLNIYGENGLKMTCLFFLWEFGNSRFENKASGKTKMDAMQFQAI